MFPPGISLEPCSQAQREMRGKAELVVLPKGFQIEGCQTRGSDSLDG